MSKPALFWTLKPKWYVAGFEVLRVTMEKHSHYYGGTDAGSSNARADKCRGRFDTREAADQVIEAVNQAHVDHNETITLLTAARNRAEKAEREAIEAIVTGRVPAKPLSAARTLADVMSDGPRMAAKRVRFGNG